ncbi:MAG: AtpZ/AtpI family protein [Bacteroidetes bacterium]|nr:AtpZ/AtpI family protein [Bacteroidota bacterium]
MKPNYRKKDLNESLKLYSRYSSIAIQMLLIILIGVFGGMKIDQWIAWKFPVFTTILSVSAVILSIYIVTKDLWGKSKFKSN